jgi:hypothetical protein
LTVGFSETPGTSNVNVVKRANSVEIGEADALAECRKFLEWGKGLSW